MSSMEVDYNSSESESESRSSDDEGSAFDVSSSGQIPMHNQHILEYPKNGHKFIKDDAKHKCKLLKFTQDWTVEEIFTEIKTFQRSTYPILFGIIFEADVINKQKTRRDAKRRKIDDAQKRPIKTLLDCLTEFSKNHPFILQWTSKKRNKTKFYYKDENSKEFYGFDINQEQPKKIKNFVNFLWSFMNNKIENFEDAMVDALPNVKNLCLIWYFLNTLELSKEFFNRVIINCAAKGTKDQLFITLDAKHENGNMLMNKNVMRSLTSMYKLDSCSEQSILSVAVENSNVEVMKYLTEQYSHFIKCLPFNHQVDISTAVYKLQNLDFLCDLVEFCDFPFPKDFDASSVGHERLKNIIKDRQEFHEAVKVGRLEIIDDIINRFFGNEIIYSTENKSALYQAASIKNFSTFHHLRVIHGLESSQYEEKYIKIFTRVYAHKVIVTDANVQSSVPSDDKIVAALIAKTSVHVTRANKHNYKEYHDKIKKWYQQIKEMKFGSALLKVVSSCDKVKIVFDFEHEHTSQIDYIASDECTMGIALSGYKWIFVGAKDSGDFVRERRIRGTIAHEFCHYAIYTVFKNCVKPYYNSKNSDIKQLYQTLIRDVHKWLCEQPKNKDGNHEDRCENIILWALTCYGDVTEDLIPNAIEQELIVRVVDMLAYFHGDEAKIRELEMIFAHLFNFYATHVNAEFEKFDFEVQRDVTEFNEKSGILRELKRSMYVGNKQHIMLSSSKELNCLTSNKITIVITNISKLFLYDVFSNIHQKSSDLFDTENVMISAEQLEKRDNQESNKLLENFEDVLVKASKLNVFIDCSRTTDINPTWHSYNQNASFIYIVENQEDFKKLISNMKLKDNKSVVFDYSRSDLTIDSQNLLLSRNIFAYKELKFSIHDCLGKNSDTSMQDQSFITGTSERNKILTDNLLKLLLEDSIIDMDPKNENHELKYLFIEREFLRKQRKNSGKIKFENLIEENLSSKYILIADDAGTGKSYIMENTGIVIKEKDPTKWVTYVDLKQFIDIFELEGKKYNNRNKPNFPTFFTDHIISSKMDFEKELFKQMYKIGKVVILFDGFDEIAPNYAEFVSSLAESFDHNGSNQLWIATRDHFKVDLQKKLNIKASYKFSEITKEEGIDLICKIWALDSLMNKNYKSRDEFITEFNRLIVETNYEKNASILVEKISNLSSKSIGLVYLYRMLADIGKDNIDEVVELTEYLFYKKCAKNHYEKWTHEKGRLRKEANQRAEELEINFFKFHIYQAMKLLAPEFAHLCKVEYDKDEWRDEDIIGCGLMVKKVKKFDFIHRTFAEFFVAEFAVQTLDKIIKLKNIEDKSLELITKIIQNKEFKVIRMFIDRALGENKRLQKIESAVRENIQIAEKISKISQNIDTMSLVMGNCKYLNDLDNITKLVTLKFHKENFKEVKTLLSNKIEIILQRIPDLTDLGNKRNLSCIREVTELLVKVSKSCFDVDVYKYLVEEIQRKHGNELAKMILKGKIKHTHEMRSYKLNIIQAYLVTTEYSKDKFEKYLEIFENVLTLPNVIDIIKETINDDVNIFHLCIWWKIKQHQLASMWLGFENFFNNRNSPQIFRELVAQGNSENKTILHYAAQYCVRNDFHETLWNLLLKTFEDHPENLWNLMNKTSKFEKVIFLHFLMRYSTSEIIKFTLKTINNKFGSDKFMSILEECDRYGNNVLHYARCDSPISSLECLMNELNELLLPKDMRKILSSLDYQNQNLLQLLHYESVWNHYREYFNTTEILNFIVHLNKNKCNLLQIGVESRFMTNEKVETIWNKIKKTIQENEEMGVKYSQKLNKYEQYIKKALKVKEKRNNFCIEPESLDLSWIEDKYLMISIHRVEQFQDLLNQRKIFEIQTDIHSLAAFSDLEVHKLSWDFLLEKFLNKEELKNFLLQAGENRNNYIHQLMSNENLKVVEFTLEMIRDNFEKSLQKEIFNSRGSFERSLLQTAANNCENVEVYTILWEFLSENLKEEIEDLIEQTDLYENCLIFHATRWSEKDMFEIIWTELKKSKNIFNNFLSNLIERKNKLGQNILHRCISGNNKEIFELLWTEMEIFFKNENSLKKFREFITQGKRNGNMLCFTAKYCDNLEFHETLWKLLIKTFENHRNELWDFLIQNFKWSNTNFFYDYAIYSNPIIIKCVIKNINDNFGSDKLSEILGINNDKLRKILLNDTLKLSSDNFVYLINKLYQLTKNDDIRKMLSNFDDEDQNLLQSVVKNNSMIVHECAWKCMRKYFDESEIRSFTKTFNKYENTIFGHAVMSNTKEIVEFTWNQIKSLMTEDEQAEYLKTNNENGYDLRRLASCNRYNPEVADWIKKILMKYKF